MYLSRPPYALKSLIRLYVGLRTGHDLGYILTLKGVAQEKSTSIISLTGKILTEFVFLNQKSSFEVVLEGS